MAWAPQSAVWRAPLSLTTPCAAHPPGRVRATRAAGRARRSPIIAQLAPAPARSGRPRSPAELPLELVMRAPMCKSALSSAVVADARGPTTPSACLRSPLRMSRPLRSRCRDRRRAGARRPLAGGRWTGAPSCRRRWTAAARTSVAPAPTSEPAPASAPLRSTPPRLPCSWQPTVGPHWQQHRCRRDALVAPHHRRARLGAHPAAQVGVVVAGGKGARRRFSRLDPPSTPPKFGG